MAVTVSNLAMGPGSLHVGAFGATEPLDAAIASPPGAGWTDVGGTNGGIKYTQEIDFQTMAIDQLEWEVGGRVTKRSGFIETQLAEVTLTNLALAAGGTVTPGSGSDSWEPEYGNMATSGNIPDYIALILDCQAPGGLRRRIKARKVFNVNATEIGASPDGLTVFAVKFQVFYVSSVIAPIEIVDEIAGS
jgi:hypothetical protein